MSDIKEVIKPVSMLREYPEELSEYSKEQLLDMANTAVNNYIVVDATRDAWVSALHDCDEKLRNCNRVSITLPALINMLADSQTTEVREAVQDGDAEAIMEEVKDYVDLDDSVVRRIVDYLKENSDE